MILAVLLVSACDSHSAEDEYSSGSSRVRSDSARVDTTQVPSECVDQERQGYQFTLRFVNETPWPIDSLHLDFFKHYRHDGTISGTRNVLPGLEPGEVSCKTAFGLRYVTNQGFHYYWNTYRVTPFLPFRIESSRLTSFIFGRGEYVYYLRLNQHLRVHNRSFRFKVDDLSTPDLGVRITNKMSSTVRNVVVDLPDTSLSVPELAPLESTDYFMVDQIYRYAGLRYVAGRDTVDDQPDDYMGERLRLSGRFTMEVDTFHLRMWFEEGDTSSDHY